MRLNVNTTQKKVYRQIVEVIRSIPPLDMLRNRDLEVLAILMYYNFKYREVKDETIRWRIINSPSTKKEMEESISMSDDIFNNNMSHIRKAGLLDKDNKIPSFLQVIITDKYEVKFNFNIKENE